MKQVKLMMAFCLMFCLVLVIPLLAQTEEPADPIRATANALVQQGQATLDAFATQDSIATATTSVHDAASPESETILQTTPGPTVIPEPVSAPIEVNGTQEIAFLSNRDGAYMIYTIDITDTDRDLDISPLNQDYGISALTFDATPFVGHVNDFVAGFSYAPDGRRITFGSDASGGREIYTMNSDGTDIQRLTFNKIVDSNPAWSPSGRIILFKRSGPQWITMQPDGSAEQQMFGIPIVGNFPSWSLNGKMIAVTAAIGSSSYNQIYIAEADGANSRRITTDTNDFHATWSPEGDRIVFASNRDGNDEIYIMDTAGNIIQRLTDNPASDIMPSWSPDGNQILFTSDRGGNRDIYVMNIDGSDVRQITYNEADDLYPVWKPIEGEEIVVDDSQLLAFAQPNVGVTYRGPELTFSWRSRELGPGELYVLNIWTERQTPSYFAACTPIIVVDGTKERLVNFFAARWQYNGCAGIFADDLIDPPASEHNFRVQLFITNSAGIPVESSNIVNFEWIAGG
jgi:Tol biopolymer transport system component